MKVSEPFLGNYSKGKVGEMTVVLRDYGHTKRSHVIRTVHTQNVAEHSHGVALFAAQLYGGKPSANLLLACLYHDLPECVTGDVPATAKWNNEALAVALSEEERQFEADNGLDIELTPTEKVVLKLCDLLDLGYYCVDELLYGNRHVNSMYHNVVAALDRIGDTGTVPEEVAFNFWNLYKELNRRYHHATNG